MAIDVTAATTNDLRKRVLEGQPYTKEELAAHVRALVAQRIAAATAAPKAKATSKKQPTASLDDLL
jgi:hypothetical protein